MDEIVKQAMAKWPNVPAVYGWLRLDRRGNWLIRGDRVTNPLIAEFIGRNYGHDDQGRWYFQNGPQRVFIALDYTPYIYRLIQGAGDQQRLRIETHTQKIVNTVTDVRLDENGNVLLATEFGIGVLDDRDLESLLPCFTDMHGGTLSEDRITADLEQLQNGGGADLRFCYRESCVPVTPIKARRVAMIHGFDPQPSSGEACI